MVVLFNYSSLMERDTKIYSIGGSGIPGGLSINFTKVVFPVALVITLVGYVISLIFGLNMFNFMALLNGKTWNYNYLLTVLAIGIGSGLSLWHIQIGGYRLYQYLIAYLKPKKVYTNNMRNRDFQLNNIKIKTTIRQIL